MLCPCRSTFESLISVLGISEETVGDFTAHTASDIADRSVELYQILERLAKDGDTICQVLEAQTLAQGDNSSGRNSVRLLKTILPHIRAFFSGRVGQGLVQDGEVSSTESVPASNENTTSSPSPHLPNSRESSGENVLSIPPGHVPSTLEGSAVVIQKTAISSPPQVSQNQSSQPVLGRERGAISCTENAVLSTAKASSDYSQSVSVAGLDSRLMLEARSTVSDEDPSPAVQMMPTTNMPVIPLQPSVSTHSRTVIAPATLEASMHAANSMLVQTCQPHPVANTYATHTFLSSNTSVRVVPLKQPNAVRAQADVLPQPQLQTQQLSHAGLPRRAPTAPLGQLLNSTKQTVISRLLWLGNQLPAYHPLLGQYRHQSPESSATFLHSPQSAMIRFQGSFGANPMQLPAQQPLGGLHSGQLPRSVAAQAQALPVMPSIMTPAIHCSRREERRSLSPPFSTAFTLHGGEQLATQGLVHPQSGLPVRSSQHNAATVQQGYQSTQSGGQHMLGTMLPSQPLFQPLSGSFQKKNADPTLNPQSLTLCNHSHISVRQAPPEILTQTVSCVSSRPVVTAPQVAERAPNSQSVQEIAHSNHSKSIESMPVHMNTLVEPLKMGDSSVEQGVERCSVMSTCEQKQLKSVHIGDASKSQHAKEEASGSANSFGASTNDTLEDTGSSAPTEPELVVASSEAGPSSSECQHTYATRAGDNNNGSKTPSLGLQDTGASPDEVQVLATGSVRSLTHTHPVEVPHNVPPSTPSCRELATLSPATDEAVNPALDPNVSDHAMEADEPPHQTSSTAASLSVDCTAHHLNAANFQSPMDPPAQAPVDPTIHTELAIDPNILPRDPTICPPRDQATNSSRDPAIQPPTGQTVHTPMDTTILQRDVSTHSPVDPTIKPSIDATIYLPGDQTVRPARNATPQTPTAQTIRSPVNMTVNPPADVSIQHPSNSTVGHPQKTTTHPPTDPAAHPPMDSTVDLPTGPVDNSQVDPTVCPPTEETTSSLSIKAKVNAKAVSNGRRSFVSLMKQHALVHLTLLARLTKDNPGRLATHRQRTATHYPPPGTSSGMTKGVEFMETSTAGCFPTSQVCIFYTLSYQCCLTLTQVS